MSSKKFAIISILNLLLTLTVSFCYSQDTGPIDQGNSAPYTNVSSCPPWTYHKSGDSNCTCGDSVNGVVLCNKSDHMHRPWCPSSKDEPLSVCLLTCHCMSYSEKFDTIIMGECPYLCTSSYYYRIPTLPDRLNTTCTSVVPQNRTGQLCSKCINGYAPAVYSCLLYTSPSPRDATLSRMPSSA